MLELIPYDLRISPQYIAIFDAYGKLVGRNSIDVDGLLDQTFIETATWGLELLEKEFGIETDISKSITERRSVILSKKRGIGTVTVDLVKSVAESFYGGQVEVKENFEDSVIEIKFISNVGVPPNQDDVYIAVAEILPAHLFLTFEYTYILIRDIHDTMSIAELETKTLDKFAKGDT